MLIFKENLPAYRIGHEKYAKYVEMPYGDVEDARQAVLHVDLQNGEPCMWYDAAEYDLPMKKYLIVAVRTGDYLGKYHGEDILTREMYIRTVLLEGGSLVLHYFLVDPGKSNIMRIL